MLLASLCRVAPPPLDRGDMWVSEGVVRSNELVYILLVLLGLVSSDFGLLDLVSDILIKLAVLIAALLPNEVLLGLLQERVGKDFSICLFNVVLGVRVRIKVCPFC